MVLCRESCSDSTRGFASGRRYRADGIRARHPGWLLRRADRPWDPFHAIPACRAGFVYLPARMVPFSSAGICRDSILERNASSIRLYVSLHLTSAFLLQNGVEYMAAHAFGVLEYIVEWYMVPSWKQHTSLYIIGLALLLVGQALRSLAMIHASTNFSHALALTKREDHVLVTTGVYAYVPLFAHSLGMRGILRMQAFSGGLSARKCC